MRAGEYIEMVKLLRDDAREDAARLRRALRAILLSPEVSWSGSPEWLRTLEEAQAAVAARPLPPDEVLR